MNNPRRFISSDYMFIGIAVLGWIAALLPFYFYRTDIPTIIISTVSRKYYHHQFIEIKARVRASPYKRQLIEDGIPVSITKDNQLITGIGSRIVNILRYVPDKDIWYAAWPCPWNAPVGQYKPIIPVQSGSSVLSAIDYISHNFTIVRRPLYPMPKGLSVMIYETNDTLSSVRPPLILGGRGMWQNIFDWCEFTGTDALWLLGGQTAYFTKKLSPDFPWLKNNLSFLSTFGEKAHRRGILFGAYAMAYLTFGKKELKPDRYAYAVDYNYTADELYETRAISLSDEQRKKDIIEILKIFDAIEEMDFIGLDYIRNALGGYELVDEFVVEMNVLTPESWNTLDLEARMKWLARKKIDREDMDFIDQWQWWQAHKSASLVEEIKREVNSSKPFWVFTLSWERGWQHGQDPVMMNDAGADIDAVMLYETDAEGFKDLLTHWRSYASKESVNPIVGDVIDWNLHQKTFDPAGPEEYFLRNMRAINSFYTDGSAKGVFLHDLHRLMWGRRGPYSRIEWALAGAASVSLVNTHYKKNSYKIIIDEIKDVELHSDIQVAITVRRTQLGHRLAVRGELFHSAGLVLIQRRSWEDIFDDSNEIRRSFQVRVIDPNSKRRGRHYIAARIEWLEGKRKKSYTAITYFNVKGFDMLDRESIEDSLSAGRNINGHIMIKGSDPVPRDHDLQKTTAGE